MKKSVILIISILFSGIIYSQQLSNLRSKSISTNHDTVQLDTLSIIPSSLSVKNSKNEIVQNNLFTINYPKSYIVLNEQLLETTDTLIVSYRVFPLNFNKEYFHKDTSIIKPKHTQSFQYFFYEQDNTTVNYWNEGLNKSGSISRGISFGNNQDASLNSNLNLQLSGKLNNELNISAAISDANIPIQPDGSSQQIQEFDKVYINIYNEKTNLIAGDFQITSPKGYFLRINKKAKGAIYETQWKPKPHGFSYKTTLSGALSKGKYCRKNVDINEGNQGPYKINGCENERYIIILSGSEKIYIDGKLLIRGQENDYIINYNTAEVSFTPNQPITKDKRVIIEFEYSEQNYARFLVFNSNEFYNENNHFYINFYNEQDSKNQTLNVDLNDSQKLFLSETGDDIENAYYPNFYMDTIYSESYIYYRLKDTLINYPENTILYDSVFEYSTNPDVAKYRLGFSFVGENEGNYISSVTNVNGRVYEWTAPDENGIRNGSYEPVILLVAPKKKQVISAGGSSKFGQFISNYEIAISNSDINTFSNKNSDDDLGYALKIDLLKPRNSIANSNLDLGLHYEFTDKHFNPVERFRSAEFNRDWNIQDQITFNQHLATFNANYNFKNFVKSNYSLSFINQQKNYNANRSSVHFNYNKSGVFVDYSGSFLKSTTQLNQTRFFRHNAEISKEMLGIKVGVINELENNIWNDAKSDSLLENSIAFNQWEFFIKNPDTTKSKYFASYKRRQDFLPLLANNDMIKANRGEDVNFGIELLKDPKKTFKSSVSYRKLFIQNVTDSSLKADNSLLGRIEGNLKLLNGSLQSTTFYEIGSGLESVKEYSFVEVDRGLGLYIWNDYNQNNIQEIEEFEIASYKDTANYIRVQLPGEYIRVYSTSFNQVINLRPGKTWYKQDGIKKYLSRFSDRFTYRMNSKTKSENILQNLNPIIKNSSDSVIVSMGYSIKNTIFFNRSSSKFGVDYMIHKNSRKDLLLAGFNLQENMVNNVRLRWNITRKISLTDNIELNNKHYESETYSSKNYDLIGLLNEAGLSFQPNLSFRIIITYKYAAKDNRGIEKSIENNLGTELKYNIKTKGTLNFQFNYLNMFFNGETNSPLAYTMLEGFSPGNNLTWTLQYQQQLANSLQLNIIYNGRKLENNEALHSGGVQLRAFF